MRPIELGQQCIDIIFNKGDFELLKPILAEDCKFRGPLYSFETAKDYIKALKADPPKDFKYEIINAYEDYCSSCLVYEFNKKGKSTIMTQVFEIENDKIQNIFLVYDTAALASK